MDWDGLIDAVTAAHPDVKVSQALFDPGMGRVMKEWVLVPAAHSGRWVELAGLSLSD